MTTRRDPSPPTGAIRWIRDPAQIEALASPLRQQLIDRVEAIGPCSVRELAEALGRRPDALYYHVRLLLRLGLLAEVGARPTAASPEALYDLPTRRWHIAYEPDDPENAEALRKVTRQMVRQAERDFTAGLASPSATTRGPARNLWALRLEARLSAAERRELVAHLEAIALLLRRPRRRRSGPVTALTWVLAPLDPDGVASSDGAAEASAGETTAAAASSANAKTASAKPTNAQTAAAKPANAKPTNAKTAAAKPAASNAATANARPRAEPPTRRRGRAS